MDGQVGRKYPKGPNVTLFLSQIVSSSTYRKLRTHLERLSGLRVMMPFFTKTPASKSGSCFCPASPPQGTYTYVNGDVYAGSWKNNEKNGNGRQTFASSGGDANSSNGYTCGGGEEWYDGEWKGGRIHGTGMENIRVGGSPTPAPHSPAPLFIAKQLCINTMSRLITRKSLTRSIHATLATQSRIKPRLGRQPRTDSTP